MASPCRSSDSPNCNQPSQNKGLGVIYIAVIFLLCSIGLMYHESLRWLVLLWGDRSYSHGYFVPIISLYLAWEQRERFKSLPVSPAYAGALPLFLCCLSLLFISRHSAVVQLEAISLFLIIPAAILFLFGWKILRAAALPCLYLVFMFPAINELLAPLHIFFQRISALIGTRLLSLFWPVFRDDIIIQLPSITMQVARECSGVNFFISVLAVAFPLVYLTQRSKFKAFLVIMIGCMLTVLSNGFRVAMAGVMGQWYGAELLHGPGHIFQGWFVAWFGWAGLFVVNWLIAKESRDDRPLLHARWRLHRRSEGKAVGTLKLSSTMAYPAVIISFFFVLAAYFASPLPVPLHNPLLSFPVNLGRWSGSEIKWFNGEASFPGADDELQRMYRYDADKRSLYLYINYYGVQTEGGRLISRFSRPLHKKTTSLTLPFLSTSGPPWGVNRTTLNLEEKSYNAYYWYQFPRKQVAIDRNNARLTVLKQSLSSRHNNGAFVLIAIDKTSSSNDASTDESSLFSFIKDVGRELDILLP